MGSWKLASLTADWHVNVDFDRIYFPLAFAVYGTYTAKLLPQLTRWENAQNLLMVLIMFTTSALNMLAPAFYRRNSPMLRLLMLTYCYLMPVLTSLNVMHAFTPAPSDNPYLNWLIDSYSLWLSTRNALLGWAAVGTRPPLYLAVPFQLFGLWRVQSASFCLSPVLRHQVMQDRTAVAHFLLSFLSAGLGSQLLHTLVPATPEQRCGELLLFYNLIFAFILPLIMLLPLRRRSQAPSRQDASSITGRVEQQIERCLRLLMWPERGASSDRQPQQQDGAATSDPAGAHHVQAPPTTQETCAILLLRWWVLLVIVWSACCLLAG